MDIYTKTVCSKEGEDSNTTHAERTALSRRIPAEEVASFKIKASAPLVSGNMLLAGILCENINTVVVREKDNDWEGKYSNRDNMSIGDDG